MSAAILHLCSTCAPNEAAADALRQALTNAKLPAEVRLHPCLNLCAEPTGLSLQGRGRATLVLAGVDARTDRADIVATVRHYLSTDDGWFDDASPCGRLRFCLKARLPAI